MSTLRPLVLSLLILSLLACGLPVTDSLAAHWASRAAMIRNAKGKHYRHRHSRAWWRRRRAMLRRRRAIAMRRRSRGAAGASTANGRRRSSNTASSSNTALSTRMTAQGPTGSTRLPASVNARIVTPVARTPFDLMLPATWSSAPSGAPGEMRFVVRSVDGKAAGTAVLGPVRVGVAKDVQVSSRTKSLGDIPLPVLRRTVIDRMVAEGGWVINEVERDIHGRRVYIVFARTGASGSAPQQSWTFYFAEVGGRVYSLSTNTLLEFAEPVASASEQVVSSFRVGGAAASVAATSAR